MARPASSGASGCRPRSAAGSGSWPARSLAVFLCVCVCCCFWFTFLLLLLYVLVDFLLAGSLAGRTGRLADLTPVNNGPDEQILP